MSDLEEMLRAASREPQPEGPPAGGFAELQRRLGRPPTPAVPWTYLGLCTLLVVLGTVFYLAPAEPIPDSSPSAPYRAPLPAPTGTPDPAGYMPTRSVAATAPSQPPRSRPVGQADVSRVAVGMSGRPFESQGSEPLASRPDASRPEARRATPSPLSPLPGLPLSPLASPLAVTLPAVAVPQRIRPRARPQWDVRFNVYPHPARQNHFAELYREEPPMGNSYPKDFVIDGKLRLLHGTEQINETGRFLQPIGQLQITRHTRNGMSYGLGATYFRNGPYPEQRIRRHAANGLNRYVAYTESDFRMWLLATNVGYTFPTASRWSPWIHGGLQFAIRSRERVENRLLEGDGTDSWPQTTVTTINYPMTGNGTWVIPNLEAGILYRLSGHWHAGASIGTAPGDFADILPTIGAEVRFRW